jgi:hypothetical protein
MTIEIEPVHRPLRGEVYEWNYLRFTITRVSKTWEWADIKVDGEGGWSKRQPLPLPRGSIRVAA